MVRLSRAAARADIVVAVALKALVHAPPAAVLVACHQLNESICATSADPTLLEFQVVVYNPMGRHSNATIRLPLADTDAAGGTAMTVTAADGTRNLIKSAVLPAAPCTVVQSHGLSNASGHVLVFTVELPALTARAFTIRRKLPRQQPPETTPPKLRKRAER